jgi:2,3-diketo-5-methylthio-1-phosphopentane phosphatase
MADQGILVSDFDGTMTAHDFYDLVCQEFPQILSAGHWQHYEAGRITHFEALRRIFAEIRASESQLFDIIRRMEIEPELSANVVGLAQKGWSVIVASAGCDWYIRRLLDDSGVKLTVHANPGTFSPERGIEMTLPTDSPFFSPDLGINKVAVVRDALKRSPRVAFAGDGRPDLAPALLVSPHQRFAKSWLAKKLQEIGEEFRPFDHWHEVAAALMNVETR